MPKRRLHKLAFGLPSSLSSLLLLCSGCQATADDAPALAETSAAEDASTQTHGSETSTAETSSSESGSSETAATETAATETGELRRDHDSLIVISTGACTLAAAELRAAR